MTVSLPEYVIDRIGRKVNTLCEEQLSKGTRSFDLNVSGLSSEVFIFFKVEESGFIKTITLLKR